MSSTLNSAEEAQLTQTIEMFEVISQSQPHDYQSLEILKEAYSKLGREKEVVGTSKRIAQAYMQMGQLSSAILEYETILQRYPDDPEVQTALRQIESKADNFPVDPLHATPAPAVKMPSTNGKTTKPAKSESKAVPGVLEDGRAAMQKVFVEGKIITLADFTSCWFTPDLFAAPNGVIDPFIQLLGDKKILHVDKSLKILTDKTRIAFLPLSTYDIDMDLARSFPAATCQRWCILPFDRMSKSILVATANPFNQQAARELAESTGNRLLWYLVQPSELIKNLKKIFR